MYIYFLLAHKMHKNIIYAQVKSNKEIFRNEDLCKLFTENTANIEFCNNQNYYAIDVIDKKTNLKIETLLDFCFYKMNDLDFDFDDEKGKRIYLDTDRNELLSYQMLVDSYEEQKEELYDDDIYTFNDYLNACLDDCLERIC